MASDESVDKLLDALLRLQSERIVLAGQLSDVLKHSSECISLATELNAKLKSIEAAASFTMVTGAPEVQRFAAEILELMQYAPD